MNYQFSNKLSFRYHQLSDFHRGLFWGALFAWNASISCTLGAAFTQLFYVEPQQEMVKKPFAEQPNIQKNNSYLALSSLDRHLSVYSAKRGLFAVDKAQQFLQAANYELFSRSSVVE